MEISKLYWLHCRAPQRMTLDALAAMTGLSRYQLHRMIKDHRYERGEIVLSDRRLREYRAMGLTIREIADKELCASSVIGRRCHRLGIPRAGTKA